MYRLLRFKPIGKENDHLEVIMAYNFEWKNLRALPINGRISTKDDQINTNTNTNSNSNLSLHTHFQIQKATTNTYRIRSNCSPIAENETDNSYVFFYSPFSQVSSFHENAIEDDLNPDNTFKESILSTFVKNGILRVIFVYFPKPVVVTASVVGVGKKGKKKAAAEALAAAAAAAAVVVVEDSIEID
jgi:hypothetical protein